MMTRPSSPTSLIWAHQLKRENGFLLNIFKEQQASQAQQDVRLKTIEAATNNHNSEAVDVLTKEIREANIPGVHKRIDNMECDFDSKVAEVKVANEAMVSHLERLEKAAEVARREDESKAKLLIKRLEENERDLALYILNQQKLGERIDEARVEDVKVRLQELREQIDREGGQMRLLQESMVVMEKTSEQLRVANGKMGEELGMLKVERMVGKRAVRGGVWKKGKKRAGVETPAAEGSEDDEDNRPLEPRSQAANKTKGRKAAVKPKGKAKRAAIPNDQGSPAAEGSDEDERQAVPLQLASANRKKPFLPRKEKGAPNGGAFVPIADNQLSTRGRGRKPHHWSGIIADEDVIQTGLSLGIGEGPAATASHRRQAAKAEQQPPIIRAGRGWIEVADVVKDEDEKAEEQSLGLLGYPSAQRLTRRARQQLTQQGETQQQMKGKGTKRKAGASPAAVDPPLAAKRKIGAAKVAPVGKKSTVTTAKKPAAKAAALRREHKSQVSAKTAPQSPQSKMRRSNKNNITASPLSTEEEEEEEEEEDNDAPHLSPRRQNHTLRSEDIFSSPASSSDDDEDDRNGGERSLSSSPSPPPRPRGARRIIEQVPDSDDQFIFYE